MGKRKDGKPQMPKGVRYICGLCGKGFANRELDCKRHMIFVHGVRDPVPLVAIDKETGTQRYLLANTAEATG